MELRPYQFALFIIVLTNLVNCGTHDGTRTSTTQARKVEDIRMKFVKFKVSSEKQINFVEPDVPLFTKQTYSKVYVSKEQEQKAQENYARAQREIDAHNLRRNETYKRSTTEDSDLSYAEKKVKRMGLKRHPRNNLQTKMSVNSQSTRRFKAENSVPASLDYR